MRLFFADLLALLTAVSGWFYLFYSSAAHRLAGVESAKRNALRVRLRRINGMAMFLLAIGFFAGFNTVDVDSAPKAFLFVWVGVVLLLLVISVLVLIDMRMTSKLANSSRTGERQ